MARAQNMARAGKDTKEPSPEKNNPEERALPGKAKSGIKAFRGTVEATPPKMGAGRRRGTRQKEDEAGPIRGPPAKLLRGKGLIKFIVRQASPKRGLGRRRQG